MDFFATHEELLTTAVRAISERGYWSAYPESPSPKVYGENAAAEGKAAFEALLGKDFPLDQPSADRVSPERSPLGIALDVRYPRTDPDQLIANAQTAWRGWRDASPSTRAGVALEILSRLHKRVFELANAVHATTGQAFVMAFQAGGPHALDRALEAVAYGYSEQTRQVPSVTWTKKNDSLEKTFHVAPRGIGLVIGCNTFPTWNSWPGLFASLVTGNPVIVKPHPHAVLPLAITVQVAREVLAEAGFDPNIAQLAVDTREAPITKDLALRPEVKLIDFTGSTAFGDWLEANARQALVYTEKAGVNTVVIDSTRRLRRHVPQPRLLAAALQRPDVHHAAEPADPQRRHRHRGRAQEFRRGDPWGGRRGFGADRRSGQGGRADRSHRQRRDPGPDRQRAQARRGRARLHADRPPGLSGCRGAHADDRQGDRRVRERMLRAGQLRRADRVHSGQYRHLPSHGRCQGRVDSRGLLAPTTRCSTRSSRPPSRWVCTCRRTSPVACSSTNPRPSPTSTPRAPTRPRTRRSPTVPLSRVVSG